MKLKLITTLKYHWSKILSVFLFVILLGAYANIFAIDNPFSPGQTLNPNCGPLEANCYIDLNTGGGSNPWLTSSNGIYYDGGSVGIGGSDISINTAVSGGVIWDNIYEEEISSFAVSSEVDSNGNNVSAFYSFGEGANLTLLICRDESCDDSDSYNIASGISVGEGFTPSPSLKIGSDGSIHIAYLSLEPTEGPIETNFFYATCNISGCESPEITPISFSGGIDPEMVAGYSLALDENDDPYIIFGSVIISEGEEGSGDIFSMMNSSYLNTARYVGSGSGNCGDGDWSCSRITEGMFPGYMGMMGNAGDYAYIDESDGYPRFIANTFNMISESEILFNLEYFKCEDSSCSIYSKDTINSLEISSFISSMDEGDVGTGDMLFYMLLFGSSYIDVDSNNNPAIVFNHLDGSLETEPSFNLSSARYVGSGNGLGCDSSDWNCTNILSTGLTEEEDLLSILMLKDFNIDENDNLGILGIGNPFGSGGNIVSLNYLSCLNNSCSSYSISEIVQDEISSPEILFFLGLSSLSISDSGSTFVTHSNYDDATIKIFKKDELRGISLDENNALYSAGDLGISGNLFVDGSIVTSNGIYLNDGGPSNVNNALYNNGGDLYWMGNVLATEDYVSNAISNISIPATGLISDLNGNTFGGTDAGINIVAGSAQYNTGIGYQSLFSNTTGNQNTANGYSSLSSNTTGSSNTANGMHSLYSNTTGSNNTANGYQSLYSNTTGYYNTANGYQSLYSNTTGYYNTANGYQSLFSNTTGPSNTANGYQSLYSNTTGYYNTANGYQSLYSNTTGSSNTANGSQSLSSNTTGDSNTANGAESLWHNTTGYHNTASGVQSLRDNTTGIGNTANGYYSLRRNITGNLNIANGYESLDANTTGSSNTALGYSSLYSNKTGSNGMAIGYESQRYANDTLISWTNTNTSVGYQSLRGSTTAANNTGVSNSAFGYQSMMNNTSGFHNTANGYNSLYSNTSGAYNVAIGHDSLYSNISGYSNVALGMSALNNNTTGGSNVAIGPSALHSNITGDSNVAVGNWAGTESSLGPNTTSSNSVYVGNGTRALFSGGFNEIVIGSNTTGNGSNTTTIGTGNVLYVGGSSITGKVARFTNSAGYCDVDPLNASLVCSSDITLKKNITTLKDIEYILNEQIDISSSNLEKLLTLTPVKYNWNSEADDISKHTGFIAQEVEQLFPELVSTDENTELKSISYSGFTPYIVEAIKELNLKVEAISLDDNDSNIFSSVIKKVENGIAYLTGLVVDTIVVGSQEKRTGITLYDEETGDPYCITIVNGEMINREGECGVVEMPDICPNIDEYQQEIPDGYELNENNECIEKQDLEIPVDPSPLSTATPSQE